ncbi:helix-turn-helix transcriptional regulator [Streptomyces inhibens]|uniref:helix-turn-helix transcriptional regulator n=1 Tax=Streptomyces inhibens TaxID=2293571 RepID=UPI00402A6A58
MDQFAGCLVGRETETAALKELAASASSGVGQAAFVVGEPGAGKTAVLGLAASMAQRAGMRVLHGAAQELEQRFPFALLSACLGVDATSTDASRARVAEVLRGDARYGLPGAQGASAGVVDFAIVEAMLALVDELCAQGPLALLLDDLQWADPASLLVLQRLARTVQQLPLLVVGAYRSAPQARDVDRLSQSLGVRDQTALKLAPLSPPAVSALLADVCGGKPGPRLRRMADKAAGNPLYVKELAAALLREEAIEIRDGIAEVTVGCPIPPLTKLITHRLRYLREEVPQALRVASVLGAGCTVTDLATVLDRPTHELLSIVADAEAAGILREVGDRLTFRHDLIRHALYDAVPGSVRAMLHLKTAQALATAGAAPERVAEHLLVAAPAAGEFLTAWLVESAAQLTTRAPATALQLIDQALALADPHDARHDHLQWHRAIAQLSCGHLAEAEETARCALARTRDVAWECPLRWIIVHASYARGRPDLALIETRLACSSQDVPAIETIRFQAFSAVCLFALGKLSQAEEVAATTRCAAEAEDDGPALAYALHILAAKRFLEAPGTQALELAQQATRLTPHTIHPAQRVALQLALANSYIELDRTDDAHRTLASTRKAAEYTGGFLLPWYHLSCALLAFNTGRWDDALTEIEAGLEPGEHFAMSRALRAVAAIIALHRGQPNAASTHLIAADAATDTTTIAWFYEYLPLCADVFADGAQGNPERAYTRLATAFDHGIGHLPGQSILCFLTPDLVRLALAQGDTTNAHRYARAAQTRADHSGGPYHLGDAYRCQGLLTQDPDLLLEAARCYRHAPRPLNEAHSYTDAAHLLAQRHMPREANTLLDKALTIYNRLDAAWHTARATSRLRTVAVRQTTRRPRDSARNGWEALTNSERVVADHVAAGKSNPEIAARIFISRRTVSTHVSHILQKLRMTSRVEIAAEVIRRQNRDRSR